MVSGVYSVDQAKGPPPYKPKPRAPPRPKQSPPLPPSQLRMVNGTPFLFSPPVSATPPSPPPRISSMRFKYLPENNLNNLQDKGGPGRLPIYRSESPSTPDGGKAGKFCCRARRGISLASALLTAAAALLALLLLLGAIAYFLLLADSNSEPNRVRYPLVETLTESTLRGEETSSASTPAIKVEPSYAPPPPRPSSSSNHNSTSSTEPTSTSSGPSEASSGEPLYKDIVVSYQPYKPHESSNGDVVTAGFVPHWFREELANTGEERASTPNRFTTTSPVHVSPTLPSATTTKQHYQDTTNSTDAGGALCHSPRLEACRGVLPYDLTTMQSGEVAATTARLEAAAGALGFAHVAQGACRLAARQLLCAILEPPCQPDDRVLLPCRAACQAAVSECGEFLLATLGLGSEFDCTRYPDTRDAAMCVDLTGECESPSVRCASSGACVPSQWRCDTRDDCSDSSDEKSCRTFHAPLVQPSDSSHATHCRPGQTRCLDGACIEASHLCDGLQHCSRGEDEAVCPPS